MGGLDKTFASDEELTAAKDELSGKLTPSRRKAVQ